MTKLALYIHWPFCKSKCPYCDFNSHVREKVAFERWQAALLAEMDHMRSLTGERTLTSIFFGGGTPSLMPASIAHALIERSKALWPHSEPIEITLEANPTSVEVETFPRFKEAGVNRLSIGVQSLREEELSFLGRGHNVAEAIRAIEWAAKYFERYSFDLIYARPHQTVQAWEAELSEALAIAGGHLSLYQLTIEENTAFHTAYAKGQFTLPDEETAEHLYRLTEALCARHGLHAYEVSNYAKAGHESRHNLTYWQGGDYVGIGPGAHGRITTLARFATQTIKSPERWLEATTKNNHGLEIMEPIDRRTEAEERLMMGLRLTEGIDYAAFQKQCGYDLRDYINLPKRDVFIDKGLLENNPDTLQTTLRGRLLLNSLTAELLS